MREASITEKQLSKLEEISELVIESEEQFKKLDEMSSAIAEKWRRRREVREAVARQQGEREEVDY